MLKRQVSCLADYTEMDGYMKMSTAEKRRASSVFLTDFEQVGASFLVCLRTSSNRALATAGQLSFTFSSASLSGFWKSDYFSGEK